MLQGKKTRGGMPLGYVTVDIVMSSCAGTRITEVLANLRKGGAKKKEVKAEIGEGDCAGSRLGEELIEQCSATRRGTGNLDGERNSYRENAGKGEKL